MEQCLALYEFNPTDFSQRFVTVDETWIHHYTPEIKQGTYKGEPTTKNMKSLLSAGKVMATVFGNVKGTLLVDYLEKDRTINVEFYANLLDHLKQKIIEERPGLREKL